MSKLILVLALAVISLARPFAARHRPFAKDITPDKTSLYYYAEQMNDELVVNINIDNEQDGSPYTGKVKINTLKPLFRTPKQNATLFQILTDDQAGELDALVELNDSESACGLAYDYYEIQIYSFLGLAIYSYKGNNIMPSITGLIANSPNYITYTDVSIPYEEPYLYKSCGGQPAQGGGVYFYDEYYTSFAIEKYGILDIDCHPNTYVPQVQPAPIIACTNTSTNFASYLKGYRIGVAYDQSASDIRDLLLRFGPVLVDFVDEYLIIIGWESDQGVDYWTAIEFYGETEELVIVSEPLYNLDNLNDVLVIFNVNDLDKCIGVSEQTVEADCPCPSRADTVAWEADPRHIVGGICASGSLRATWAVIAAVLFIPVLSLFF